MPVESSTAPPQGDELTALEDHALSGTFAVPREFVATIVPDRELARAIDAALHDGGYMQAGPDAIDAAWTVLADARGNVDKTVRQCRQRMRSDAALIAIVGDRAEVARALQQGAFACVVAPLISEELLSLLSVATAARSARDQVADLSKQLDLQEHLASIGRLSAGLTHEISNPLTAANLNLDELEFDVRALRRIEAAARRVIGDGGDAPGSPRAELREALDAGRALDPETIIVAARAAQRRIGDLLRWMKELVGKKPASLTAIDLREVVERVHRWAQPGVLAGVDVELLYEPAVARANARLLEQILVNLIDNAAIAARAFATPRLRLHVYERGDTAVVSVRDNGPGIPEDLQRRVFEPFFTTRRASGGTGLGLALCREYARQIGATITLWSVPGRGTCFRVHLRRA
ncbi:MAG: HAMP domain-containing histidine kinase [Deltaproteobacteria bacterium]|nr:HAMP domain-containing histidine kinase [Deltaproteobacteria bacterium]